jgi:pyochelin biosynthetic protein PchC
MFQSWRQWLPSDTDLCAVTLPRETRTSAAKSREELEQRWERLIEHTIGRLEPLLKIPFVLFGHSMGALLAYEIARRSQLRGRKAQNLIVSARAAPQNRVISGVREMSDSELMHYLVLLGGTSPGVFKDPELCAMVVAQVRDDMGLCDAYAPGKLDRLNTPLTIFGGNADPTVSMKQLDGWRELTIGRTAMHIFPGGHFYLIPPSIKFQNVVLECLESC